MEPRSSWRGVAVRPCSCSTQGCPWRRLPSSSSVTPVRSANGVISTGGKERPVWLPSRFRADPTACLDVTGRLLVVFWSRGRSVAVTRPISGRPAGLRRSSGSGLEFPTIPIISGDCFGAWGFLASGPRRGPAKGMRRRLSAGKEPSGPG